MNWIAKVLTKVYSEMWRWFYAITFDFATRPVIKIIHPISYDFGIFVFVACPQMK